MIRLPRLTPRQVLIVLHDLVATAAAIVLTFVVRFDEKLLAPKVHGLEIFVPIFVVYAGIVYFIIGLHPRRRYVALTAALAWRHHRCAALALPVVA